jgi:ribosomal protein L24E
MDASSIEISRYSGGSGRKCTSSGRMMLGLTGVLTVCHVVRTDGTVVRWASGRDRSIIQTANREPKSSIFHAMQSLLRVL